MSTAPLETIGKVYRSPDTGLLAVAGLVGTWKRSFRDQIGVCAADQ